MHTPLDFLGLEVPPVYFECVARARSLPLATHFYRRPMAKVSRCESSMGSKLVRPPHERLVAESHDKAAHLRAACDLRSVQPEFDRVAAMDLVAAVHQCVQLRCGGALQEWRSSQLQQQQE